MAPTNSTQGSFADKLTKLINEEINRVTAGAVPIGETLQQLLEVHQKTERVQQRIIAQLHDLRKTVDARLSGMEEQLNAVTKLHEENLAKMPKERVGQITSPVITPMRTRTRVYTKPRTPVSHENKHVQHPTVETASETEQHPTPSKTKTTPANPDGKRDRNLSSTPDIDSELEMTGFRSLGNSIKKTKRSPV